MTWRGCFILCGSIALIGLIGCDGKDPERLNRVGKKLAEKGRKFTEETPLPKVELTYPQFEKPGEKPKSGKEATQPASLK